MSLSKTVTVTFSWEQLARELDRLAPGETQQVMIPYLVSSLQKQSPFMNSDLLLREIVSTVACISDQTFPLDLAAVFDVTDQSQRLALILLIALGSALLVAGTLATVNAVMSDLPTTDPRS